MDLNSTYSDSSPPTSRTDELLSSILDELKHIRNHLPSDSKPESASKSPELSPEDRLHAEDLNSYQEFESLMIELDEQLERCAGAARFLGASAAFITSTYDLRDSLARLFSCLNLNAVVLYPEVTRKLRFLVTRLNIQRPNREARGTLNREPIPGYPYKEMAKAWNSSVRELRKYEASISSMTELVNISLIESLRDFRSQLGNMSPNLKPSTSDRNWTFRTAEHFNDSLKNLLSALKMFEEKTIPAIQYLQRDETDALQNQSTVATFLSAVTATTIQFTYATPNPSNLSISVNLLWLVSLTLSLGSAVTSQLAIRWKAAISHNPDSSLSKLLSKWIGRMPVAFLAASMLTFIAGLTSFAFLIFPRSVIPPVVTCFSGSCTLLLLVIGIWLGFEETLHDLPSHAANHFSGVIRFLYAHSRRLFDRSHSHSQPSDIEKNARPVDKDGQEEEIDEIIRIDDIPAGGSFVVEEFLDGVDAKMYDLSPDGSYVAVLSKKEKEGDINVDFGLWSAEKPFEVMDKVWELPSDINRFSWAPDSRSVVLLRDDVVIGFIVIEDSTVRGARLVLRILDYRGCFMSWALDGKSIFSVEQEDLDGGNVVNVLSTDSIKSSSFRIDILLDGSRDLNGVWHTRDSKRLVAVLGNNEVHVTNPETRTSEDSITLPEAIRGYVFSRRDVLAMTSLWGGLYLVRVDMEEDAARLKMTRLPLFNLQSPRFFGEDDKYLAAIFPPYDSSPKIVVWDVDTTRPLFSIPLPDMDWFSPWNLRGVPESLQLLAMWRNEEGRIQIGRLDTNNFPSGEDVVAASRLLNPGEGTEPDADVDDTDHADT